MTTTKKTIKHEHLEAIEFILLSIQGSSEVKSAEEIEDLFVFIYEMDKCLMRVKEVITVQKEEESKLLKLAAATTADGKIDETPIGEGKVQVRIKPELSERFHQDMNKLMLQETEIEIPAIPKPVMNKIMKYCKLNSYMLHCLMLYFSEEVKKDEPKK